MRKMLFGALGSMLLLVLPALSFAGPITWTYTGTCDWGACSGESIFGTIIGDPAEEGIGGELNEYLFRGEIEAYNFSVGSYSFSGGSGTAVGTYVLDTLGNIVSGSMSFGGGDSLFSFDLLGVGAADWSIKQCALIFCSSPVGGGKGSYTASVPEPGTLALFGLGILATGFAARRRRFQVKS